MLRLRLGIMKIMGFNVKINKDELLHECQLIGLNPAYEDMVLRGKIDIDFARHLQSEDEDFCCNGEGCPHCIPF